MKRLLLIAVFGLLLAGATQAQLGRGDSWIVEKSEAEPNKIGWVYSAETYLQNLKDICGIEEYHNVINLIEGGKLTYYVQSLRDKHAYGKKYIDAITHVKYMDSIKTCFVVNGKYYVLTYKPTPGTPTVKDIYLFRRDDDSMRIASGLIRQDYYHYNEGSKQLMISMTDIGSVYKIVDSMVVIVTKTIIRDKDFNKTVFNTVILLIPDGNEGYNSAYFEPKKKILFDENQTHADFADTDNGFKLTYKSGTIIFKIVGNDIIFDESSTIKLERVI